MSRHTPFSRKPLSHVMKEAEGRAGGLRPSLTAVDLVAIGVGATIGAGIFVLSGVAAREAGPAVILSFSLAALGCLFAALAYAELAAAMPVTGSAYAYVYAALGELLAWLVGWTLILEYLIGAAMVAGGWSGYVSGLFKDLDWAMPAWVSHPVDLLAVVIVTLLAGVVLVGIRESAHFTKAMVLLKLIVVCAVIAFGAFQVDSSNWRPFAPGGLGSILKAASLVFLAYVGFDVVSATAAEVKEPARDLPRGILGSLLICTVLYAAMSAVLTGMISYAQIDVDSPITSAFNAVGMKFVGGIITAGALIGMASVLLALMIGLPRILLAMARDGLLPGWAGTVHARTGTPVVTTVITAGLVALAAAVFPIESLASLAGVGTLTAFAAVCASVAVLRRVEPDLERPFRFPGPSWAPWMGVAICLTLMAQFSADTWMRVAIWLAIGLTGYLVYGRRMSRLAAEFTHQGN